MSAANIQNVAWAAPVLIFSMRALKNITRPNGASMTTHINGVPKITCIKAGEFATP